MVEYVVAEYTVAEDRVSEFVTNAMALEAASKQENGCLMYKFTQKVEETNTFAFIEMWKNNSALELHKHTSHYNEYVPLLEAASTNVTVSMYR